MYWHNEQSGPMPRELIWAAGIGIGYGWFYASVASPFGMYLLVALASLLMLRGLQRFAVWIAVLAVIVSLTGLITAIVEGPPERLFHRLPWAIAVLCMVPLARRGRRELDSRSSPPSPNDGVAPNPQDSPATTSARVEPVSAHDPGPAQEGPHDASIPTALSGSGKTEGDPPVVAELSWVADQKKPAAPARNNPPPPAENPLRWFARPDRYRRPGDRPGETRVDAGQG